MSYAGSASLTVNLDDFFAGESLPGSTKQWSLHPSHDATPAHRTDLQLPALAALINDTYEDMVLRSACVVYLSMMPAAGLPLTLKALQDIYRLCENDNALIGTTQASLPEIAILEYSKEEDWHEELSDIWDGYDDNPLLDYEDSQIMVQPTTTVPMRMLVHDKGKGRPIITFDIDDVSSDDARQLD